MFILFNILFMIVTSVCASKSKYIISYDPNSLNTMNSNLTINMIDRASHSINSMDNMLIAELTQGEADEISKYVKYIEKDTIITADESVQHMQENGQWGIDYLDSVLDDKYIYNYTGTGVHIYIIDTLILSTHNEFNGRVKDSISFEDDDKVCNFHGTHVASLAAGMTYGASKNATITSMHVMDCEGTGRLTNVLKALDWIYKNAPKKSIIRGQRKLLFCYSE